MKNIVLSIEGMTCSACSNGLEKYLNKQNGIINASVNLVMANVTIDYDEKILSQEKLEKYINKAGFSSKGIFKEFKIEEKSKKEKVKFIGTTMLAILLMYISMGHMINLPTLDIFNPHKNAITYMFSLLILTVIFFIYGFDILKNGYKNLIHKIPNMDTLVTIGVISSFLYSLYGMFMVLKGNAHYTRNLYFESSAIVIYFVKLGRYIDGISKDKTKDAVKKLVEVTPNNATIEVNGVEKQVTLDEIIRGTILIVKPGEKVAVDGEIIEGKAHFDESFITGESKPNYKGIGGKIVAGSLNYDGYVKYKAEKIGKDSTVSEIVRLVIDASNTKAPIAKIADKISGYFVPIIIFLAILTFITYLALGFLFNESLITFVTVLLVACPCSLGLATPLAVVISEGVCAKSGILVKKSEVLENASKIDTIVFDKTGTLTYGTLKISQVFNYSEYLETELLKIATSLEKNSDHPISNAFKNYCEINNIQTYTATDFEDIVGYGIKGKVNGEIVILGNNKILDMYDIQNDHKEDEQKLAEQGNSIVYVIINNNIVGLIGLNDIVRDNIKVVIDRLNKKNIEIIMLTGDNEQTANKIASEIGILKVIANVLPLEKVEIVKKLKKENKKVMMCGDGINDSPALANSDIGVSVKSGTDIAMDSASVILINNELESIVKLINISKKTVKNIKQNLFWAFFYNVLMIPIAMGLLKPIGVSITPMIASIAMIFSSFTVIINALRLKK